MRTIILLYTFFLAFYSYATPKTYQPGKEFIDAHENMLNSYSLSEAAKRIVNHVIAENRTYPNISPYTTHQYTLDLMLEALMNLSEVTQEKGWCEYAILVTKKGGFSSYSPIPYQRQPFASINYALYMATGDHNWLPIFVRESVFLRDESKRSSEGAVMYYSRAEKGTDALLVDFIQEYCARMARCGKITWDESFFSECVSQFQIYRSLLRDTQSGLWSQGKGWDNEEPDKLSPGAWSRGHGWLLRGLTESLANMPRDSKGFKELQKILKELVEALLPLQDKDGMWHALLHLNTTESPAESSGTAMIAAAFSRIWREGLWDDERLLKSAVKAFNVLPDYVDEDGFVLSTSPGPGPLKESHISYLKNDFRKGDHHGTFAVLFAATEYIRLEKEFKQRGKI